MIVEVSKGKQITLPADIRKEFGLEPGSRIEVEKEDGRIVLKPIEEDLDQVLKDSRRIKPRLGLSAEEMDELNESMFR